MSLNAAKPSGQSRKTVVRAGLGLTLAASLALTASTAAMLTANPTVATAQTLSPFGDVDPDAQLFLEADELLYDETNDTVTAIGNVDIFYDGFTVDADQVVYDRRRSRVIATGNVVLVEPDGSIIRATRADLSDTLSDGFVEALDVETPDRTFFTARSATRRDASVTVFEDGTYTACAECPSDPDKPRAWVLNADTITYDQEDQMVYYRNVRFDLFGFPVFYLPFFAHADPTVDRKSGFLAPSVAWDESLGFSVATPYYIALDPSYDLTLTPEVYSRQGVRLTADWRQRLNTGEYFIRGSAIRQLEPEEFAGQPGDEEWRGGLTTSGLFSLNSRWQTGWNVTLQSDRRYFRDYDIEARGANEILSDVFLTGLNDRSYFDARVQRIEVTNIENQDQPWGLPIIDYERRFTPDAVGGEAWLMTNITSLHRDDSEITNRFVNGVRTPIPLGLEGQYQRASLDFGWRRQLIGPGGQVFTPKVGFRGDAINYDLDATTLPGSFSASDDTIFRAMPYAGLEWKWPVLLSGTTSAHVFEPVAQIIVRPDATGLGKVPNEDAQSLIFDATNLFDMDKYSGFDQLEGGVRANVGARYTGVFDSGWLLSAVVGQSFHLAGENPYAQTSLVRNEADSGLETDRSDYVAMMSANYGDTFSVTASGRFDEEDLSVRRGEFTSAFSFGRVSGSLGYGFLASQPSQGVNEDEHQLTGAASFRVNDEWRVTASARYDLEENHLLSLGAGLAYSCDCLAVGLAYSETSSDINDGDSDRRLTLRVSLRTLGETQAQVLNDEGFERLFNVQ
ncbi:MAG: LPS-assembly protein LptD [Pseudomonadota bacterium]